MVSEVYNRDCIEYMKTIEDNFFDWAICDIEYGIGASKPSKKPHTVKQSNGNILNVKQNNYKHSDWDFKKSTPEYFEQLLRVSKNQIIFGGNYYGLEGGYLVWDKLNGNTDQFGCELAWLSFTKRTDIVYYMWSGMIQGEQCSVDVRKALRQIGNKKLNEKRIHETQKPVKLYEWILAEYVKDIECNNPNCDNGVCDEYYGEKIYCDVCEGTGYLRPKVFDSHLGSGSNRIANYRAGNDFYACEIDKEKFVAQEKRFKTELMQPRLQF